MGDTQGQTAFIKGKKNRNKIIAGHIAGWAVFICYEVAAVFFFGNRPITLFDNACHYAVNISLFYFNSLVVLPYSFDNGKRYRYLRLVALIPLELAVYLLVSYSLTELLIWQHIATVGSSYKLSSYLAIITYRSIFFMLLSTGYWFGLDLLRSQKRVSQLETQRLEHEYQQLELQKKLSDTENAYLRAQINPHLLFNTLSFIYYTIYKVSDQAAKAVMLLSEITQYAFQRPKNNGMQNINEELEQIRNLIALNQLRFNDKLQISLIAENIPDDFDIPAMLLLTFVENMFKYGNLQDSNKPAEIKAWVTGQVFHFRTINSRILRPGKTISHGIGLENSRLRLSQQYGERHSLLITEEDDLYQVDLEVTTEYAKELYIR